MSNAIKGVKVGNEVKKIDYNSLDNLPELVSVDATLTESGKAADAKAVGDEISNIQTNYANVIRGTATGEVVRLDCVSEIPQDVSVKVSSSVTPSTIVLKKYGKNLLQNDLTNQTTNGLTVTVNEDKSVNVNGTATADTAITIFKRPELRTGVTYLLNGNPDGASENTYYLKLVLAWDNINHDFYDYGDGTDFVINGTVTAANCSIMVRNGTVLNHTFKPMICVKSTDNSYEPYHVNEYNFTADGTVDIVPEFPTTTLLTTAEDAVIECEYKQDTTAVIKKLTDAIAALGGTV